MSTFLIDTANVERLLRDYRAALPRCQNGELLKEEFAKLNLRMFDLGLKLHPDSPMAIRYHEVVKRTSERRPQGGLYAHMDDSHNLRHWIEFLVELLASAPERLQPLPRELCPPPI
jgi:hypothetical protein